MLTNKFIYKFTFPSVPIIHYLNKMLTNLFLALSINRSPFIFKSIKYLILYLSILTVGVICSLLMRFDYNFHVLNQIPLELSISIRIISVLFSIFSIFLLTILMINAVRFYKYCLNNQVKSSIKLIFTLYLFYTILINIVLFVLNSNSIDLLNIFYLNELYLLLNVYSIIYGIIFGLFIINTDFDLFKELSKFGTISLFILIISWISLFLAIRFGIILQLASKLGLIDTVYCSDQTELNNQSESNPSESSSKGPMNVGNDNKASNVNISIDKGNVTGNTNNAPQSKINIILSESVSLFKDVQIMRRNTNLTEWGDATLKNVNLIKYYQSDHFKKEVVNAIMEMLEYNDNREINIQLTKDKLDPKFLIKYNLDQLLNEELEFLLTINPKLEIDLDNSEITRVVNTMDLNIRRDNNEYYRLLQKSCTNEDNCLVSDICYQDSLSIVLKSNYSSKLIRNLKMFNEQTNSTYIPLYRILDPNFNYFKLHEILKIEGYNQELKDILNIIKIVF